MHGNERLTAGLVFCIEQCRRAYRNPTALRRLLSLSQIAIRSRTKSWSFRIHSPRGALVSRRFVTSRENQRTQLTKHTKALSESNSGGLLAQISSKVILIFLIFRSKAMFYSTIWCRMLLKSVLHLMTEPE